MDETGIALGVCTSQTVVGSSSTTRSYKISSGTREWVSIIEAISTSGQKVHPLSSSRESLFKAAGSSMVRSLTGSTPHLRMGGLQMMLVWHGSIESSSLDRREMVGLGCSFLIAMAAM